jgi:hypothetical protein
LLLANAFPNLASFNNLPNLGPFESACDQGGFKGRVQGGQESIAGEAESMTGRLSGN